ncbi:class I SAM-dependent methyltransferase family protein [Kribbella sp. NPDC056345]|uniref:class I SAM-dependent methyltransferase family protein n=1 Tax=Kribbella sp. NPDC056345 TaxID=3345789 RepID=UPI0035D5B14C
MDWSSWHDDYDRPGTPLARRLADVQGHVRAALSEAPPGPLKVVSLCAGQGRDLIEVLADHPRRTDVHALLVELDPRNTAVAAAAVESLGLSGIEVVTGDASLTDQYAGLVPADLVLACGIFGNISDRDVERTISFSPQFCKPGAVLIWTRHREAPDLAPAICGWFEAAGFERLYLSPIDAGYGVGVHRYVGAEQPLVPGVRLFTFGSDRP